MKLISLKMANLPGISNYRKKDGLVDRGVWIFSSQTHWKNSVQIESVLNVNIDLRIIML